MDSMGAEVLLAKCEGKAAMPGDLVGRKNPIGSMGLLYIPTNLPNKNQPLIHVCKYTIHGCHGI